MGIDRVHVVQPTRAKAEMASLNLCLPNRDHSSPQLTALGVGDRAFSVTESDPSMRGSGSLIVGSEAGADT